METVIAHSRNGGASTDDSPQLTLEPFFTKVTRNFSATMYMLWTSNITNSVPVPISSQSWQIANTGAANSGYPTTQSWGTPSWNSPLGPNADIVNYMDIQPGQSPYGYPTWPGLATPVTAPNCPTSDTE
jgi:hypothetical protein